MTASSISPSHSTLKVAVSISGEVFVPRGLFLVIEIDLHMITLKFLATFAGAIETQLINWASDQFCFRLAMSMTFSLTSSLARLV